MQCPGLSQNMQNGILSQLQVFEFALGAMKDAESLSLAMVGAAWCQ